MDYCKSAGLENRNNRIIKAILEKEKAVCPGSVALIGIYGSFQTGDIHPLSDLDLLILINDDRGWQLGTVFIQDDLGVGHDIYCTGWESLREDARFTHPHISKLMDSRIVYCADEKYLAELENLREQVRSKLAEPFGEEDYQRAENELKEARCCYADAMMEDNLNAVRRQAGGALYHVENALALLNKTYFRKGTRRRFEESHPPAAQARPLPRPSPQSPHPAQQNCMACPYWLKMYRSRMRIRPGSTSCLPPDRKKKDRLMPC